MEDGITSKHPHAIYIKKTILQKSYIHIILITLLGFLIYSNTFNVPFHFDDVYNIIDNPAIKDFKYFKEPSLIQKYKPLYDALMMRYIGYLTFAINYKIHSLNVTGYHIVNLVIHIFNSIIFYLLIFLIFSTPYFRNHGIKNPDTSRLIAFFASLLFVCHPIQTQAVTYIVQRLTSLATMFYLSSLIMYIKARITLSQKADISFFSAPTLIFYCLSIISAIFAMKTKEISFTLPIIIILCEFMFFEESFKKRLLFLIPFILTMLIIPFGLLGSNRPAGDLLGGLGEATRVETAMSRLDYLFTQFRVIVTYIRLLFLPVNQNIDYDYPVYNSFYEPNVFLSFLFLLSIFIIAVYFFYRSKSSANNNSIQYLRLISFGIFWFFITLSVESSVIPIIDVIFEHRLYLPSIGVFIAISSLVYIVFNKLKSTEAKALLISFSFLILFTFSIATYVRNNLWKEPITLWEDVIRKSPNKARGYNNLGFLYTQANQHDKALYYLQKATELKSSYSVARHNLGLAYAKKGMIDDAIKELRLSVELDPSNALAHYDLALAYIKKGEMQNALQQLNEAIRYKPDYAEAYNNIGAIYFLMNHLDEAIENFQMALRFKPDNAEAHFNIGNAYKAKGMIEKANQHFKMARMLKPDEYQ